MLDFAAGSDDGAGELVEEERLDGVGLVLLIAVSLVVQADTEYLVRPSDWRQQLHIAQTVH